VNVTDATAFGIATAYEWVPDTNDGDRVPEDVVNALKVDTVDAARVTVTT